ncbi:MAG: energy-coupling factor ABC transporter ATP-binding protein [Anaerolineae bacterium]
MTRSQSCIVLRKVSYSYPDGHCALDGVSLALRAGEKVGLVGPNGAGKSTLLLHLNGILRGQGQVCVEGLDLDERTVRLIRSKVGLVFQDPDDQLFCPTVFEDVAFGPLNMGLDEEEVVARTRWALAQVQMQDFAQRMPHHLSLGEKKKIAIATVLSMEPSVLALDEPSAGLDPEARYNLIGLLARLPQAMLIASHDLDLVRQTCERAIVLQAGRVVADGPVAVVLATDDAVLRSSLPGASNRI